MIKKITNVGILSYKGQEIIFEENYYGVMYTAWPSEYYECVHYEDCNFIYSSLQGSGRTLIEASENLIELINNE